MHRSRLFPFGMPLPFYAPDAPAPAAAPPPVTPPPAAAPPANEVTTPPAPAPAPKEPPANALAAPPPGDPPPAPADFPADWREKLATGDDGKVDAKALERLKRMSAPGDLWKSYVAADSKISKGKVNADEPMPADEEGAKAWRAARNIPDDPSGYVLPEDVTKNLTDADKPVLASYTEEMHKAGMPRNLVEAGARWYLNFVEQSAEATNVADKAAAKEVATTLNKKWGTDYTVNSNMAMTFATEAVPGTDWYMARLPDGRTLGNVPEVVEMMAKFARMEYGDERFAGGEAATRTATREQELKKIMDTDIDTWNRSPDLRKEYGEILSAKDKRAGRE